VISNLSGEELLALYEERGISERALAEELGMSFNALHGKIYREKLRSGGSPPVKCKQIVKPNAMEVLTQVPMSIEELLDLYKVDMSEWKIDREVVNWWGSATNPHGQLKVHLSPLEPKAVRPFISPLSITIEGIAQLPRPEQGDFQKCLVLPDPHVGFRRDRDTGKLVPFHDRLALDIAVQLAAEEQPDVIVLVGDWLDLAEWTDKYPRTPDMYFTTRPASIECAWWIAQLRIWAPHSKIVFLEGNHEARLQKMLMKHLVAAYDLPPASDIGEGLLSIPRLLGLADMDVDYVGDYPNGKFWLNNSAFVRHGVVAKTKPGATAMAVADKAQHTEIFGHIHRIELVTKTIKEHDWNRMVHAFCPGCLCHIDGRVPGTTDQTNWQQGLGLIEYNKNDMLVIHPIPIQDGVALYNGRMILGSDRIEELREQTQWEF